MKTTALGRWTAVCLSVLTAFVVFPASADEVATTAKPQNEKTHTGTVIAVRPAERVLSLREWTVVNHRFSLGDSCAFTMLDNQPGTINDLRPGQKVRVAYQNVNGILVASRVTQLPMREEGTVKTIDPNRHMLTLRMRALNKEFKLADDTKVMLRNDKWGTLADIKPGLHVSVLYETPGDKPVARQITQTSATFIGSLRAIDLPEQTLKARSLFGSKKFNVANNCTLAIDGRPDARLADLKLGDRLVLSYDELDGVNVVNRIASAATEPQNVTVQTGPQY